MEAFRSSLLELRNAASKPDNHEQLSEVWTATSKALEETCAGAPELWPLALELLLLESSTDIIATLREARRNQSSGCELGKLTLPLLLPWPPSADAAHPPCL